MRFFLDNCMSPNHAIGLRGFAAPQNIEIRHLRERFPPSTKDVEWITALSAEGDWIIISGDVRITKNPAEKKAWLEGGLTAFFFTDNFASDGYWRQAADLVAWWSSIVLRAHKSPTGHGFLIKKKAKEFQQIFPAS